jgi:Tol biopolymer transport system component
MPRRRNTVSGYMYIPVLWVFALLMAGCGEDKAVDSVTWKVPHEGKWGIYVLNLTSGEIALLYSSDHEIAGINLSNSGGRLAFSMKTQDSATIDTTSEIYTLDVNNGHPTRITDNHCFDSYPSFSPDDSSIVFLSMRDGTLDLYMMDSNGGNQRLFYNSGGHDADVDWGNAGRIAFTRDHQIWSVNSDGTDPRQETDPPDAGLWGNANLPIGDYDPRFSPDGSRIAFERMVDVSYITGGYDIYVITVNGDDESNLTNTGAQGYAQGLASWSHSGDRLVYILAAIKAQGKYRLCMINSDGSGNRDVTPDYFPPEFLCHCAVFSLDDANIYFVGQWWQQSK